jgi:hypothetical protein
MKWKLIVILATAVTFLAFAFVFRYDIMHPYVLSMPYILWSGILVTALMVVLTWFGARYFPHKEK